MKMNKLEGTIAIITGGSRGIGAAIAKRLAADGAKVAITYSKGADAAAAVVKEIERDGGKAIAIQADATDAKAGKAAVEKTVATFGGLDVLVNNAGINDGVGLEHGTPEKFVASLQKNLLHVYNMTHFALPELKKSHGAIVNIASKTAVTGQGGTSGYVAAKGGILGLTREWAVELLPYGIRVNAVVPAEVMTPLYQQWLSKFPNPDEKLQQVVSKIPLGKRMTQPEEIAATVLFLISSQAAHVTGQHLYVDGGYVHLDRALT